MSRVLMRNPGNRMVDGLVGHRCPGCRMLVVACLCNLVPRVRDPHPRPGRAPPRRDAEAEQHRSPRVAMPPQQRRRHSRRARAADADGGARLGGARRSRGAVSASRRAPAGGVLRRPAAGDVDRARRDLAAGAAGAPARGGPRAMCLARSSPGTPRRSTGCAGRPMRGASRRWRPSRRLFACSRAQRVPRRASFCWASSRSWSIARCAGGRCKGGPRKPGRRTSCRRGP